MEEKIIETLKRTGFPFEFKVRKRLMELGVTTTQSRYYIQYGNQEISKDLDIFGYLHSKTYHNNKRNMFIDLKVKIIGEVKDWANYSICFYELDNENPENMQLIFPNFLNNGYKLINYLGGKKILSEIHKKYGIVQVSKSICIVENLIKSHGNKQLFEEAQSLALACEYQHKKEVVGSIRNDISFPIHACFPILIVNSKIYKIINPDKMDLEKVNFFLYFVAYKDPDMVPLSTKDYMYFQVMVINYEGLDAAINLLKELNGEILKDVEFLISREDLAKRELTDYYNKIQNYNKIQKGN